MIPGYTVRPARASDLDALLGMYLALQDHVESSSADLWRMTPSARRGLRAQLQARLSAPDSCVLVAQDEQAQVVAMAFGRVVVNNQYTPARTGSIDQLFVHPDHRRRQLGTRLISELGRWLESQAVSDVSLRYASGNEEAAAFWAARGFTARIVIVGADVGRVSLPGTLGRHP